MTFEINSTLSGYATCSFPYTHCSSCHHQGADKWVELSHTHRSEQKQSTAGLDPLTNMSEKHGLDIEGEGHSFSIAFKTWTSGIFPSKFMILNETAFQSQKQSASDRWTDTEHQTDGQTPTKMTIIAIQPVMLWGNKTRSVSTLWTVVSPPFKALRVRKQCIY